MFILAVAALVAVIVWIALGVGEKKDLKYSEFQSWVYSGEVKEIYVKDYKCYVFKSKGSEVGAPKDFVPEGNKYDKVVNIPSRITLEASLSSNKILAVLIILSSVPSGKTSVLGAEAAFAFISDTKSIYPP